MSCPDTPIQYSSFQVWSRCSWILFPVLLDVRSYFNKEKFLHFRCRYRCFLRMLYLVGALSTLGVSRGHLGGDGTRGPLGAVKTMGPLVCDPCIREKMWPQKAWGIPVAGDPLMPPESGPPRYYLISHGHFHSCACFSLKLVHIMS